VIKVHKEWRWPLACLAICYFDFQHRLRVIFDVIPDADACQ
jgi:hypothetical protein